MSPPCYHHSPPRNTIDPPPYLDHILSISRTLTLITLILGGFTPNSPKFTTINLVTKHSNCDFIVINIPEEDVEPKQIILNPDDQPMWESAKTVAPTPNSAIIQLDVDDNFVINSTHFNMIRENKFDGYMRADPHDHIREFLTICDMFKYGKTQSEAVKLMIFPLSLSDKAKTWFNELNEESITSWEQMRKVFTNRFFPPSLFNRLLLEIKNFSQLDLYSHQSLHDSNDSEKSLTELNNDMRNNLKDFKICVCSIRTIHWKLFARDDGKTTGVLPMKKSKPINQEPQFKTDFEKLMTKFLDDQRVINMFFKNNVTDMILKMKQNENNFQAKIKNMEIKIDEWEKSQNIYLEQTNRTDPHPPQAHTKHVNVVFTRSGKSDDHPKIQKDPPPSIIVNNKIKKDRPIKTSKENCHVIKTKEYPYHTMDDMNIPANDVPAEQAPAIAPPIRTDDQTNRVTQLVLSAKQFWDTMCYDSTTGMYRCKLDEQWFNLHKEIIRDALQITPTNDNDPFVSPLSSYIVIEYVNTLGYPSTLKNAKTSYAADSLGYHPSIQHRINASRICGRNCSSNSNILTDKKKFDDDDTVEIRSTLRSVGKDGREIFGLPVPDALLTDEIKRAPYYGEYLEQVAKYQQFPNEERGKAREEGVTEYPKATKVTKPKAVKQTKPSAPKASKVTKPADDKAPKQTSSQPPKSTPAPTEPFKKDQGKKRKPVKETSDAPSPTKRSKAGKVTKKRIPKGPLQLVDEFVDEGVPEKEPVYGDKEANLQRALKLSLKDQGERTQGPARPVVFREHDSGRF
ncbi:reverse transcriptase domain-containing protein [Tanacetum coccineum]|uniref:Reverse transcriptase domain-containing protein n=1 Tax=Tanacetum coccineum TaxID=301880 RepID=A0ABQ5J8X4_9ASTR